VRYLIFAVMSFFRVAARSVARVWFLSLTLQVVLLVAAVVVWLMWLFDCEWWRQLYGVVPDTGGQFHTSSVVGGWREVALVVVVVTQLVVGCVMLLGSVRVVVVSDLECSRPLLGGSVDSYGTCVRCMEAEEDDEASLWVPSTVPSRS